MRVPEGKEKKYSGEKNMWRNTSWKLSKLGKRHKLKIKEVKQILNKLNLNKSIPKHFVIKLLKTKDKKKNLKNNQRKPMHYSYRNNDLNDYVFLAENHRGQKEFSQHFLNAERKEVSILNSVFTKKILQKCEQNNIRAFTNEGKLRIYCQQTCSKIIVKGTSLDRREMIPEGI